VPQRTLIRNIGQLATPVARYGNDGRCLPNWELRLIEDAAVLIEDHRIAAVGRASDVASWEAEAGFDTVIDADGGTVTPGLVDAHTHPVFWHTREHEFEMRVSGKSYEEIAAAGGGIRFSVRDLRQASREQLVEAALPRLDRFLAHGTTTIEAKSGYGLSWQAERLSLEVIRELDNRHPLDLVPTFLGAHEVPDEFRSNRQAYLDLVVEEMIPQVAAEGLAEFCDVFCEQGVFSVEEARRVLVAAREAGLKLKIHADQLTPNRGAGLAAELGAVSADHLEHASESDLEAMRKSGTAAVLLPGAVFFIGKTKYAPARKFIELGLVVAVATDFNPGSCMSESLPLMLTLSCLQNGLTPSEALVAATYHAACAIDRGNQIGTLEVGKRADLVIWDAPNYLHLAYHFGINLVRTVIKNGRVVV
jgi:imidazolonepropionase